MYHNQVFLVLEARQHTRCNMCPSVLVVQCIVYFWNVLKYAMPCVHWWINSLHTVTVVTLLPRSCCVHGFDIIGVEVWPAKLDASHGKSVRCALRIVSTLRIVWCNPILVSDLECSTIGAIYQKYSLVSSAHSPESLWCWQPPHHQH